MADNEQKPGPHTGTDEAKLLRGLREASIKTNVAWLRSIHQAKSAVGSDEVRTSASRPSDAKPGLDVSWLNDLVVDVATQHLAGYNRALDLGSKYGDRFVGALREVIRAGRTTSGNVHRQQLLEVSGDAGKRADGAFGVRNSTQARAEVSFRIGEFTDVAGGKPFAVKVDIVAEPAVADPAAERSLAPGESRVYRVGFDLAPPFEAAHRYSSAVDVCVQGRVVDEVPIVVAVR